MHENAQISEFVPGRTSVWKWPWVSRRAYDFMEEMVYRLQQERDEQQKRADRAVDELIGLVGRAPVSTPAREELKEASERVEKYMKQEFDDPTGGMIDESIVEEVEAALVGSPASRDTTKK